MFKWLRERLSIEYIIQQSATLRLRINELERRLDTIQSMIGVNNSAVARMIASLDPMYRKSELSPERKAKSDQIGKEILHRLWAEDAARKHSLGEPIAPPPEKTKS
jgi:hypothetical protein